MGFYKGSTAVDFESVLAILFKHETLQGLFLLEHNGYQSIRYLGS